VCEPEDWRGLQPLSNLGKAAKAVFGQSLKFSGSQQPKNDKMNIFLLNEN